MNLNSNSDINSAPGNKILNSKSLGLNQRKFTVKTANIEVTECH